ncbi:MAG: hypothetical protein BECKG1743E_GA0114224_110951, partial [Candidatus Kentron sp. G]
LCACYCALNPDKMTAQSGIFFSGNHLIFAPIAPCTDHNRSATSKTRISKQLLKSGSLLEFDG